jgi:hypothetical protein
MPMARLLKIFKHIGNYSIAAWLTLFYDSGERTIQAIRNRGYTNSRPHTRSDADKQSILYLERLTLTCVVTLAGNLSLAKIRHNLTSSSV